VCSRHAGQGQPSTIGSRLPPSPERRWRLDLTKADQRGSREPLVEGCPCEACTHHSRGYLHYLARGRELTGSRLITLHNLTFMAELMRGLRAAIAEGRYAQHAERVLAGDGPY